MKRNRESQSLLVRRNSVLCKEYGKHLQRQIKEQRKTVTVTKRHGDFVLTTSFDVKS